MLFEWGLRVVLAQPTVAVPSALNGWPEVTHAALVEPISLVAREAAPYAVVPAEEAPRRWYGWQTLTVDAVAVLGLVASQLTYQERNGCCNDTLAVPSLLLYFFGAPTVHWAHGYAGTGFASLGFRAAAALGVIAISFSCVGGELEESPCKGGEGTAKAAAMLLLASAPIALDGAVLAWEDEPPPVTRIRIRRRTGQRTSHVAVAPWRDHAREAWGLQLSGAF